MTCYLQARQCLWEHVLHRLECGSEVRSRPGQYAARCPVRSHGDTTPSLHLTVGNRGFIIWDCKAGCSKEEVRAAMVRQGILDRCLPGVPRQRTEDEVVSALTVILETEPPGAARDLHIGAVLWNRGKLPAGSPLVEMGERLGYRSRSHIYGVTAADRGVTAAGTVTANPRAGEGDGNTVLNPSDTATPNQPEKPQAVRRVAPVTDSPPQRTPVRHSGQANRNVVVSFVRPSGQAVTPEFRQCEVCQAEIPPGERANKRFHSAACKQKAYRQRRKAS